MSVEEDEGRKVRSVEKIGAFLRRERESRGLTLEDIALRTRIQRVHLEAIEKDDYGALPAGPFLNGFINSYARTLGLDSARIAPMLPDIQPPPLLDPAVPQEPDWRGPQLEIRELPVGAGGASWTTWVIALVVVSVLAGFAIWFSPRLQRWVGLDLDTGSILNVREPEPRTESGELPAPVVDAPASDDVGEAADSATETKIEPVSEKAPAVVENPVPAVVENPVPAEEKTAPAETSDAGNSADDEKIQDAGSESGDAPKRLASILGDDKQVYQVFVDPSHKPGETLDVEVVARYKTYIRVSTTLGGAPVFESVLQPDEKRRKFSAAGDLWMVIGNGGGVDVYFNGNLLEKTGRIGERVGLAFRPAPTP